MWQKTHQPTHIDRKEKTQTRSGAIASYIPIRVVRLVSVLVPCLDNRTLLQLQSDCVNPLTSLTATYPGRKKIRSPVRVALTSVSVRSVGIIVGSMSEATTASERSQDSNNSEQNMEEETPRPPRGEAVEEVLAMDVLCGRGW